MPGCVIVTWCTSSTCPTELVVVAPGQPLPTPPERRHSIADTRALVDKIRRIAFDHSIEDRDIARRIRDAFRAHSGRTSATTRDGTSDARTLIGVRAVHSEAAGVCNG